MKYTLNEKKVQFEIGVTSSDLTIEASEVGEFEVIVEGLRKNTSEEIFEIDYSNGILKIKEKKGGMKIMSGFFSGDNSSADIKIKLPIGVTTEGKVGTVSGDIDIDGIAYNGKIGTVSGDIKLHSVDGDITIGTVSGDIDIEKGKLKGVSFGTVSGDIQIESEFDISNEGQIKTVSGDINLNAIEYLTDKKIHIKTVSGDISKKGKITDENIISTNKRYKHSKDKNFDFEFNFLGEKIQKIVNSTVKNAMKSFASIEKADISVNTDKEKGESVEKILTMVEDGKISADEAAKLIKAL